MRSTQIHSVINLLIDLYYRFGLWQVTDGQQLKIKLLYCIYHLIFVVSLVVGAITNAKREKAIFLAEVSIAAGVVTVKLWLLIWKQNRILDLANRVCVFSIRDEENVKFFNMKLAEFTKFVKIFIVAAVVGGCFEAAVFPLFQSERTLFLEIGFPLDWKNSAIAFLLANIFLLSAYTLTVLVVFFSIIIWYLFFNCSLRYKVLENDCKNMVPIGGKMSEKDMHSHFLAGLETSIDTHLHLRMLANELESLFSGLFFIQFSTSGVCICFSIYCLAFDIGDNLMERLMHLLAFSYFIAELFMITYFGNEIMIASNRLSYSLFESDWTEQPLLTKKCMIIFGEHLKKPQRLLTGKIYPLNLVTFTKILHSAYNMFVVLKGFQ